MNFSQLMSLATGHVEARIVQTSLELNLFETLEDGALQADQIAGRLRLEVKATELLLNSLCALELLEKQTNAYALRTPAKTFLLKSSPQYVGGMIRFESALWRCWERLPEAVRTGKSARAADMYQNDAAETQIFINAMDSLVKARGDAEVVIDALDWRKVTTLLDLGSGPGTYSIALCRRFSHLRAAIFDLPGTLAVTERYVHDAGMADRIELIGGDYRSDPIPGKYDVIFLSNIVHGEDFEKNQRLILKLAKQLNPAGRIVIKDHVLEDSRTRPPVGAIFSILMLLTTDGGRCYTFTEIKGWLERAGLCEVREIPLPAPMTSSLVIGVND